MLKKIHHLIRYFAVLGLLAFYGYSQNWNADIFLPLIGPCIYLAHGLKKLLSSVAGLLPNSVSFNHYAFLLPVALAYYCILGFQLKQLWNERGRAKFISLLAMILFLVYIHFLAWRNINEYMG